MRSRISRWGAVLMLASPLTGAARTVQQADAPIRPPLTERLSSGRPSAEFTNAPVGVQRAVSSIFDQVLFDEPGDGTLWTRGQSFKAKFDGTGATFIPFFGSSAPQNYPLEMHVSRVDVGGVDLPFSTSMSAARDGQRVTIDHGTFVEQYDVALESLEQRFVFDTLPRPGDLVVRMNAATELTGSDLGKSLRFENDLGRVDYGEAFAVDATGRKLALDSTLVDGAIQLTVPADFVAHATLPLTIDPYITSSTVSGTALYEKEPDVSYDVTTDRWCVSWSTIFSATDYDAYVRLLTGSFTLLSTLTIDFTTDTWTDPHIANNNANNVFLVVASAVPASGVSSIRGRLVYPGSATVGPVLQISPIDGDYRNGSDVGGDTYPVAGLSWFCVVWQRSVSQYNVDIEMQLVNPDGTLHNGPVAIDNSIEYDTWPSISNSTECQTGSLAPAWTVVWERRVSNFIHEIWGAQFNYNGSVLHTSFPIHSSTEDETLPAVSTILDDAYAVFGIRPYLVTFERNYGDKDIWAVAMLGSTAMDSRSLSTDYSPAFYSDQVRPSVDSDGSHFLVGWTESAGAPGNQPDVFVSDYYLLGASITPCEVHGTFANSPQGEGTLVVSSMASGGGPRERYCGTWEYVAAANQFDIQGGLWDGCSPGGVAQAFCSGDGSGTVCPCGNSGAAGNGCANSQFASGANLAATGISSISADTVVLNGSNMPNSSALYFQGTTQANVGYGSVFGDGLRCAAGSITRLGTTTNVSNASSYPGVGDLSVSVRGAITAPGSRTYQVWYRNAASFCTASTFNLSNGLYITWTL